MEDETKGLYDKFKVTEADGTPVEDKVFVLRPERDVYAQHALFAYAELVGKGSNPELALAIYAWLHEINPAEW